MRRALLCTLALAIAVATALSIGPRSDAEAQVAAANSADRMIFWVRCGDLLTMDDAALDRWKAQGVDGFACAAAQLRGLGGPYAFTGDASHPLVGAEWDLQRGLRDSRLAERAAARGMKLYLGVYLVNYYNTATPLMNWFDDAGWATRAIPAFTDLAAAARLLGFAGLVFDEELYPQTGGATTATWSVDYPGAPADDAVVRAKVRQRGAQVMAALVGAFPDLEIVDYDARFPGTWEEHVQATINARPNARASSTQIDFWDGMLSTRGYGNVRFYESAFYKTTHISGVSWDAALRYEQSHFYALLSQVVDDWSYASTRVSRSPFAWINSGPSQFEASRPPAYVADQLAAFRRWSTGGEFANFVYGPLAGFDYGPYVPGMVQASQPGVVDSAPPTITTTTLERTAAGWMMTGEASDDFAVRLVAVQSRSGVRAARLTTLPDRGDGRSYVAYELFVPTAEVINLLAVYTEDIHGLRNVLPRG